MYSLHVFCGVIEDFYFISYPLGSLLHTKGEWAPGAVTSNPFLFLSISYIRIFETKSNTFSVGVGLR